jgi:hypothetical protein
MNAAANIPQQPDYSHSAAAADIDDDGDIDLYIGNTWGQARFPPQIWINNGNGVFSVSDGHLPPDQATLERYVYTASALADVNNDGAPDLILGANETTLDSFPCSPMQFRQSLSIHRISPSTSSLLTSMAMPTRTS